MKQWHLFCLLPLMAACDSGHSGSGELISVDLRQGIDHPSMLNLQDEVESVEYIPLETTDDPASLLDGVSEYALTSKYIYVSPVYLEPSKQLQTMKNTWRQTFVYQLLLDFNTSNLLFGGSQKSAYLCNAFLPRRILRAFILPSRGQS